MSYTAPVVISLFVSLLFMLALRPVAMSVGLVDRPGGRKAHIGDVPIIGGISMLGGLFFGLTLIPGLPLEYWYLLPAATLLATVGVVDDKYDLPATGRLIAQTSAALMMIFGGDMLISNLGNPLFVGDVALGPFGLLFTVLVTITVINAFNMVDGMDGLAGSLVLVALSAVVVVSDPGSPAFGLALVTCAALVGFLIFNFPLPINREVRTFMGDAGSTMLGLIVVWLAIGITQGESQVMSPVAGLWFAAVPLFDLFTCMVRRIAKGRSPFKPGRNHFHHTLKRAGLEVRPALAVLVGLAIIYATIGLAAHYAGVADGPLFVLWAIAGATQYWVIKKFAVFYRLLRRRRRSLIDSSA